MECSLWRWERTDRPLSCISLGMTPPAETSRSFNNYYELYCIKCIFLCEYRLYECACCKLKHKTDGKSAVLTEEQNRTEQVPLRTPVEAHKLPS